MIALKRVYEPVGEKDGTRFLVERLWPRGVRKDDLRALGFSRQKARAIVELAEATTARHVDLAMLASLDDAAAVDRLCGLHGVGRWTAEYVLLRGLGRLGVFPVDDVGARNGLRRWLGLSASLDYAGVQQALAPWRSYAGVVYLHLLVDHLIGAGHLLMQRTEASPSSDGSTG